MSNVIQFPGQNKRIPSIEEFQRNIANAIDGNDNKTQFALEAVHLFSSLLIQYLTSSGIDVNNPSHMKDLALVLESIKGFVLKNYDIYHPIQRLSEELFVIKEDGVIFLKLSALNKVSTE